MKTKALLLLLAGILFTACYSSRPLSNRPSDNNDTYNVEYLFEHEGTKVYRFYDLGNYVYFTNRPGEVTRIADDSTRSRTSIIVR